MPDLCNTTNLNGRYRYFLLLKMTYHSKFCVDYRQLNDSSVGKSYPLHQMDDFINSLRRGKILSILDENSRYWKIPVRKEDVEKPTFVRHYGSFQYRQMPFGLYNTTATFKRTLDLILTFYTCNTCIVYLHDVIMYSNLIEYHIHKVKYLHKILEQEGVTLKLINFRFFK